MDQWELLGERVQVLAKNPMSMVILERTNEKKGSL
jgi:hypothetical protein